MSLFDRSETDVIATRLRSIADDTTARWGSMSVPQMRAHMRFALRYSLGKEILVPSEGSPLVRLIIPLLLNGWLKLPKNLAKPQLYDAAGPTATVDEVLAELDEFRKRLEAGKLEPPPHSSLGDLGISGWCKLHRIHFDHHLRQFGA